MVVKDPNASAQRGGRRLSEMAFRYSREVQGIGLEPFLDLQ